MSIYYNTPHSGDENLRKLTVLRISTCYPVSRRFNVLNLEFDEKCEKRISTCYHYNLVTFTTLNILIQTVKKDYMYTPLNGSENTTVNSATENKHFPDFS